MNKSLKKKEDSLVIYESCRHESQLPNAHCPSYVCSSALL